MTGRIVCRVGDIVRHGRVVTIEQAVDPGTVATAVRTECDETARIAVAAPDPTPVHDHVGCLRPGMGLRTRTALARAARTLGLDTPHDDALEAAREALDDLAVADETASERTASRREVAETSASTAELRERVATARGRLQARRENDLDTGPAAADLADAIARLSERETAGAAARQQLETTRTTAREHRDRREDRLRVEDRVANLERAARAHLVEQVCDRYADCLRDVPGTDSIDNPLAAPPVPAALAVARLADLAAPVVLACDRFESHPAAADWLDAPVIAV
jgi:hypothetical protein